MPEDRSKPDVRQVDLPVAIVHTADPHPAPDPVAVRSRADKPDLQPVVLVPTVIAQQLRTVPVVRDKDVHIAIVIIVRKCRSPAYTRSG